MSSSQPADGPAILVRGLTKRFGRDVVLDGADLQVERGEMVVLAGRSGSGKSTIIHLLGALEAPDSGTIEVDGMTLGRRFHSSLSAYRREHIGIVFQLHNLVPRLTASQNVELAMFGTRRSRSQRRERAAELLERLELSGRADHMPPQLSGGERARVALVVRRRQHDRRRTRTQLVRHAERVEQEELLAEVDRVRGDLGRPPLTLGPVRVARPPVPDTGPQLLHQSTASRSTTKTSGSCGWMTPPAPRAP